MIEVEMAERVKSRKQAAAPPPQGLLQAEKTRVELGLRIREARQKAGLYQKDVARALKPKISTGAVGQWEIGLSAPSMAVLKQLPNILGVSADWLMGNKSPELQMVAMTKAEQEMLGRIREMDDSELRILMQFARGELTASEQEILKNLQKISKDEDRQQMVLDMIRGLVRGR